MRGILGVFSVLVMFVGTLIGGTSAVLNRINFPADAAAIESLRADSRMVCVTQAEDVVGQVTQKNQDIAEWRAYNANPFLDIFIPDGWDHIEPIIVPDATNCVTQ